MFFVALALGLILGFVGGGSVAKLLTINVRYGWLLILALLIRVVLIHANLHWLIAWVPLLQAIAYGSMILLALANIRLPGARFFLLGILANGLVIMANGGRMPVSEWAVQVASGNSSLRFMDHGSLTHEPLGPHSRLTWLADIIPLPHPFPFPSVVSIGDISVSLGIVFLVFWGMRASNGIVKDRRLARG